MKLKLAQYHTGAGHAFGFAAARASRTLYKWNHKLGANISKPFKVWLRPSPTLVSRPPKQSSKFETPTDYLHTGDRTNRDVRGCCCCGSRDGPLSSVRTKTLKKENLMKLVYLFHQVTETGNTTYLSYKGNKIYLGSGFLIVNYHYHFLLC